jgi:hypothetical protein
MKQQLFGADSHEDIISYLSVSKLEEHDSGMHALSIRNNSPAGDLNKKYRLCLSINLHHHSSSILGGGNEETLVKLHLVKIKGPSKFSLKSSWPIKAIAKIDGMEGKNGENNTKFFVHFSSGSSAKRHKKSSSHSMVFEAYKNSAQDQKAFFLWILIQAGIAFSQYSPPTINLDMFKAEDIAKSYVQYLGAATMEESSESELKFLKALASSESEMGSKSIFLSHLGSDHGEKQLVEIPQMTTQEADDVQYFLTQSALGVDRIHDLRSVLLDRLSKLDNANTYSLFSTEVSNHPLVSGFDAIKGDVSEVRMWLQQRDKELKKMRVGIEQIENRNRKLELLERNYRKLADTLEKLFSEISIDDASFKLLLSPDFRSRNGYKATTEAFKLLSSKIKPEKSDFKDLENIRAVKEKDKELKDLNASFCLKASKFLQELFLEESKELMEKYDNSIKEEALSPENLLFFSHQESHDDVLIRYTSLTEYLRKNDKTAYENARQNYTTSMRSNYEKTMKNYFTAIKKLLPRDKIDRSFQNVNVVDATADLKANSAQGGSVLVKIKSGSVQLSLPAPSKVKPQPGKVNVLKAFESALNQISTVIIEENEFCNLMFGFTYSSKDAKKSEPNPSSPSIASSDQDREGDDDEDEENEEGSPKPRQSSKDLQAPKVEESIVDLEKKARKEVHGVLDGLFKGIEAGLFELIGLGNELDPLSLLEMLHETSKITKMDSDCEYLNEMIANLQSRIKQLFNNFIQDQVSWIESNNVAAKKMHIGLPLLKLPGFIAQIENCLPKEVKTGSEKPNAEVKDDGSDSEEMAEKRPGSGALRESASFNDIAPMVEFTYHKIATSIFKWIEVIASHDAKYQAVVTTTNYYFFWMIFTLYFEPVFGMKTHIQQSKALFKENLAKYIKWHMEYAMPDAVQFWDLMESQLLAVSQPSDLPFTPGLSKQNLKKICTKYLDQKLLSEKIKEMWDRVLKHYGTCPDLAMRIWEDTKSQFIERYQRFEQIVSDCYRGEKLPLDIGQVRGIFANKELGNLANEPSISHTMK